MSQIAISGNASGTGVFTIASPNSNSNYTQTLPAATGTLYIPGTTVSNIQSGTSVASTSGTSIDFTSIPSWVKRITVILNGVSLSGTANFRFQLGTSAGIVSTGYVGAATNIQNANPTNGAVYAGGGFDLTNNVNLVVQYGTLRIVNITGNTWVADGVFSRTTAANGADFTAGTVVLSGTLDRVRVTSTGADTFDAGSINILYE